MDKPIDAISAALRDNVDGISRLSAEALSARYAQGQLTLLMIAAAAGSDRVVRFLLAAKIPVNATAEDGKTALTFAAERHRSFVARALLEAGANPNARDSSGSTPLIAALDTAGNTKEVKELLRVLIASGADPGLPDNCGVTAFSAAEHSRRKWRIPLMGLEMSTYFPRRSRRLQGILAGSV